MISRNSRNPIIIALDGISVMKALEVAKTLKGLVWGFKVNDLLFEDSKIIHKLKKFGKVFADPKLYDIPNTVLNTVVRLSRAGADMITVHAEGGIGMMKAAKTAGGKSKIIAVTKLTSFKDKTVKNEVLRLTQDVLTARLDGIVCSANELQTLKRLKGFSFLIKVVPGIRPRSYKRKDDQRRTATPHEALRLGADFLVIGRPIIQSKNPHKKVQMLLD